MDSSISQFKNSVRALSDITNYHSDGQNALSQAGKVCQGISEKLSKSNALLSSGWNNIATTMLKIDNSFEAILRNILDDMWNFILETEKNDRMAQSVVENTSGLSEEILKKLNIQV